MDRSKTNQGTYYTYSSISNITTQNQLESFRLRTLLNEIIVAPGKECTLVVMQKPVKEEVGSLAAAVIAEEVKA